VDSLTPKPHAKTRLLDILTVQPATVSSEPLVSESGRTFCDNLTALSYVALALQIQLIKSARYMF